MARRLALAIRLVIPVLVGADHEEIVSTFSVLKESVKIKAGTLMVQDFTTATNFEVSFSITPQGTVESDWNNILRFTRSNNDCCECGDRMPGFFLRPGTTRLVVVMGMAENHNAYCSFEPLLPLNQKSRVTARLEHDDMTIYVDGQEVCVREGYKHKYCPMTGVEIWMSDKHLPAADALIENVTYSTIANATKVDHDHLPGCYSVLCSSEQTQEVHFLTAKQIPEKNVSPDKCDDHNPHAMVDHHPHELYDPGEWTVIVSAAGYTRITLPEP